MTFEDLLYEVKNGVAWITINRPDKMNAFRGTTCDELIKALNKAGYDKSVGAIVLAGAGDRAFCTGGDQSAHDGNYDGRGTIGLPMEELHTAIRDVPKPVIARVQGFAIGGGDVLGTVCGLAICSAKGRVSGCTTLNPRRAKSASICSPLTNLRPLKRLRLK